jgi:hypothetical protein
MSALQKECVPSRKRAAPRARKAATKSGGTVHRSKLKVWLVCLVLAACAAQSKKPEVPAVPVPPREPLAWLAEDSSFLGKIVLAPFRSTPLWSLWEQAQQDPAAQASLIDASKIERVIFAGNDSGTESASFVAAVNGTFAQGELDTLAKQRNIAPEPRGLLTFYRAGQVAFAQVYPDLILVCSLDRVDAVAARAGQGDAIKIRDSALYRSLADRLGFHDLDLAMLAEDSRGELKARAERQAKRYGFAFSAQDIVRAGAGLKLGASSLLSLRVETTGEAQAQALKGSVEAALAGLEANLFVGLLGIRPLIKALGASQEGSYVAVSGNLASEDLNRALDRLAAMLGVALSRAEPAPTTP